MAEKENESNLPPPEQRCNRNGGRGWQCKNTRLPGQNFCEKHYMEKKTNKKRRTTSLGSAEEERNPVQNAFERGQQVEVANQEEGFEDSWFIATVVDPSSKKNDNNKKYLIEYRTLEAEDGFPLREYVHVCHLRPLQPNGTPPFFKPDDVVDAYVNDGWWKGVVTKVIGDSRYSVVFRRTNEEVEFEQLKLRLHMEWIDGNWGLASQTQETGIMVQNDASFQSPNPTESSAPRTDMDTSQTSSGVRDIVLRDVQSISRSTCGWMDEQSPTNKTDSPSCGILSSPTNMQQTDPKSDAEVIGTLKKATEEDKESHSSPTTKDKQNVLEAEHSELTGSPKPHALSQKEHHFVLPTKQMEEPLLGTGLEGVDNKRESVTKGKRGRPKGSAKKHKRGGSKSPGSSMTPRSKGHANESTNKETTNVQTELTGCNGDNEEATNKNLMAVFMDCEQAVEDDPSTLQNNASFPFVKSSKMWEEIESNEVLKLIPQNPHFRPLEKENEELREGFAFGYMWAFTALWERTCKASLDEPSSVFETRLEALTNLESFGFSVDPIRSRLEQMLKIKDRCTQVDRFKTIESEVVEEKRQSDELDLQLQVLLKEKEKLEMQLQVLVKEKEKKISKVAELERMADEIKESIEGAGRDFQSVVAAPW